MNENFQLAHIISYNHLYHRMKIGQKFRNPKIFLIYFCDMCARSLMYKTVDFGCESVFDPGAQPLFKAVLSNVR